MLKKMALAALAAALITGPALAAGTTAPAGGSPAAVSGDAATKSMAKKHKVKHMKKAKPEAAPTTTH